MSNPYASPEQNNDGGSPAFAQTFSQDIRGLQIVTGALALGAIMISVVMLVINGGAIDGEFDIVAGIGLGFAALNFILHLIIPRVKMQNELKDLNRESLASLSDEEKQGRVLGAFRGGHIIACAMLEGAAIMNVVLYQLTSYVGNLIAAAVLIVLIILKMPTANSMQNKINDQLREIEMR